MRKKVFTLCIIHQHPRILLGLKKRGFGSGKWNGFGGKVELGETLEEAAKRELLEEAGIVARKMRKHGVLEFVFTDNQEEMMEVHVFKVTDFEGEPGESEEMSPRWFDISDIPFSQMWQDDLHWFPLFMQEKNFKGRFLFDEDEKILEHYLEEVGEM